VRRLWAFLSSLPFFYGLAGALLAVFVWQTLWGVNVRVYGSPWFLALALLLALNILFCLLRRAGRAPVHDLVLHIGIILLLSGAALNRHARFEGQMRLVRGVPQDLAFTDEGVYRLPCSVELLSFAQEYEGTPHLLLTLRQGGGEVRLRAREHATATLGNLQVAVEGVYRDLALGANGPGERSPFWNNPAVRLRVEAGGVSTGHWVFLRFPAHSGPATPWKAGLELVDGAVSNYRSRLRLQQEGRVVQAEVAVNEPLRFEGYTFYQASFDPSDASVTVLLVKRERFLWLVYLGFLFLSVGVLLWLVWTPF